MSILYLSIKPSKIFLFLLLVLHLLAVVAIFSMACIFLLKIILCLLVLSMFILQCRQLYQKQDIILKIDNPRPTAQLIFFQQNILVVLQKNYYSSPWLVILYFKDEHQKKYSQFIWFDAVDKLVFKQLKRWLMINA